MRFRYSIEGRSGIDHFRTLGNLGVMSILDYVIKLSLESVNRIMKAKTRKGKSRKGRKTQKK